MKSIRCLITSAALALMPFVAHAQAYPAKPVRLIVGFTPGSATDVTARILAQKLNELWNVPVTVDNVPGAGGTVGAARAAKSPPDGYTLQYGANGAMSIAPGLYTNLTFDPARDFVPISQLVMVGSIVAVHNSLPTKSMKELIALAKARPGELSYASPGAGTPQHIAFELIKILGRVDITHVPYKGAVFTDVMGGRVPLTMQNAAAILPTVRAGRLKGLAQTSLQRSPNIPEYPTVNESGFPGFEAVSWFGLFAPTGTPPAIVGKLHQDVVKVLAQPDLRTRFAQLGLDTVGGAPADLAVIVKNDIAKWTKVIKEAGITVAD